MATELEELIEFLSSTSSQVKKAAVDIVQGLTGAEDGIQSLALQADSLLPPLLKLLHDKQEIAQQSATALVNLSSEQAFGEAIIKFGAVDQVMEMIGKSSLAIHRLLVMLLVNLTQMEQGSVRLLQKGDKNEGFYVRKLVRLFTRSLSYDEEVEDQYEHIAAVLVNITRHEEGRKLLLDTKLSLLRHILPQIDSKSIVRRKGVAGTVRNCCFEAESQLPSLLSTSQFLWPALLLPLAGKQAYSKEDTSKMPLELANPLSHEREVETDPQIRIDTAEALYLIAVHEGGRRALWGVNGARILQVGYEDEEDPQVMEAYERLGSLLIE